MLGVYRGGLYCGHLTFSPCLKYLTCAERAQELFLNLTFTLSLIEKRNSTRYISTVMLLILRQGKARHCHVHESNVSTQLAHPKSIPVLLGVRKPFQANFLLHFTLFFTLTSRKRWVSKSRDSARYILVDIYVVNILGAIPVLPAHFSAKSYRQE